MFKSFSASYAGHVVDDNLGLEGTPANDRLYSTNNWPKCSTGPWTFPGTWRTTVTTSSGWPSTTSSPKATSAFPT